MIVHLLASKKELIQNIQKAFGYWKSIEDTYLLPKQLNGLVGEYYVQQQKGAFNFWILFINKMNPIVTNNLDMILRSVELDSEVIAQKYIEHPLLYKKKKIDFQFIVLIRGMNPLEGCVYNVCIPRIAVNSFSLDSRTLFDSATHCTKEVLDYKEYVKVFAAGHGDAVSWSNVFADIINIIREALRGVEAQYKDMQMGRSRVIMGVNVMLNDGLVPRLLGFDAEPDLAGLSKMAPEFYNDAFEYLFTGINKNSYLL
jgi:hypothetical protein